ncbi:MAG: cobalt ECF transporter T component CbiQ [Leptolyngbya foveolarum]|uniref:Cobalt ECF transporter T component CbiQ n=1 Tax=Leptolyngbya foveolarum TaxID=47253 RepID=A0A2W4WAI8_9CYAN|nr:MAG: cobalt ECF transporter T component CbiQ [Leptolyngbya foveolarum]
MALLHIAGFRFDIDSQKATFWQTLAPRTRVLCAALLVMAIAFTPNAHWWTWAVYSTVLLYLMLISRITWTVLLKRVAVEFAFIATVLLGTLFHDGGEVVWQWGLLRITSEGLIVLGSVTLKSVLCLLVLNLLTLTTPISALLQSLVQLRVPPLLVAILASMYRYVGILIDELKAMRQAAASRNLAIAPRRRQRAVIGNMFGALFIRTYERGERVHQAMVSRGYTGIPHIKDLPTGGARDVWTLSAIALIAILGQALYLPRFLSQLS